MLFFDILQKVMNSVLSALQIQFYPHWCKWFGAKKLLFNKDKGESIAFGRWLASERLGTKLRVHIVKCLVRPIRHLWRSNRVCSEDIQVLWSFRQSTVDLHTELFIEFFITIFRSLSLTSSDIQLQKLKLLNWGLKT